MKKQIRFMAAPLGTPEGSVSNESLVNSFGSCNLDDINITETPVAKNI